jgi:hypothetical protein
MARTTDDAVFAIIDTTLTDIDTFITTANLFVTNTLGSTDLDDNILEEIECYITAHFLSARDPRVKMESIIGAVQASYTGYYGQGLTSTPYGQIAIDLDTSGTLSQIARKGVAKSASMSAINLLETPT